jgi:hypothetical protein
MTSAFEFPQAPRQFEALGKLAQGMSKASARAAAKSKSGLNARAIDQINANQHVRNKDLASHTAELQRNLAEHGAGLQERATKLNAVVSHGMSQLSHQQNLEASAQEQSHKEKIARGNNSVARAKIKADTQKDYQSRLFAGSEAAANREHEGNRTERLTTAVATNPNIRSFNASTGSIQTTHPIQESPAAKSQQFDGVGGQE